MGLLGEGLPSDRPAIAQRLTALASSAGKGRLGNSNGRCLLLWLMPPVLPLFSVCCPEDLHTHDPTPN